VTVAEPPANVVIDWAALCRVDDEAGKLHAAGKFDRTAFRRLWRAGLAAVGDETGLLQTLVMLGDPAWVED
jgi:hypothetical protein